MHVNTLKFVLIASDNYSCIFYLPTYMGLHCLSWSQSPTEGPSWQRRRCKSFKIFHYLTWMASCITSHPILDHVFLFWFFEVHCFGRIFNKPCEEVREHICIHVHVYWFMLLQWRCVWFHCRPSPMGESATYSCSQYRLDGVQEFGTLIIVRIYMYL